MTKIVNFDKVMVDKKTAFTDFCTSFASENSLSQGVVTSNIFWIMNVVSSFEGLNETDQEEYLKMFNKYNDVSKWCRTTKKCKKNCKVEDVTANIFWIMNVVSSFEGLNETDQEEYLNIRH